MARDKTIKAKVASSDNYTLEQLNVALELAIPKKYLDEYQGKGKHSTDLKVAVAWFPDGDAAGFAAEILVGTTTVRTRRRSNTVYRCDDDDGRTKGWRESRV